MYTPHSAIDWFLIAAGFFVSIVWLVMRPWLERPESNRRLMHACVLLAVAGAVGIVRVFLGADTYLHCLVFSAARSVHTR
jgi:hypothetical protein